MIAHVVRAKHESMKEGGSVARASALPGGWNAGERDIRIIKDASSGFFHQRFPIALNGIKGKNLFRHADAKAKHSKDTAANWSNKRTKE